MTLVRLPSAVFDREPTDPGKGEHLWTATVAYRMSDQVMRAMANGQDPGDVHMDQENMLCAPGLGCYKCEEPFSRRLYFRKCTGSLELQ